MVVDTTHTEAAWAEAYAKSHGDPHSVFARSMGVTRQEAKVLCYKHLYFKSDSLISKLVKTKDQEFEFLLQLAKQHGLEMTKQEVLEAACEADSKTWG